MSTTPSLSDRDARIDRFAASLSGGAGPTADQRAAGADTLVEVKTLSRVFDVSKPWLNRVIEREEKKFLKAVTDVSFNIGKRETLALVGESGSGKSTVAKMVVGLLKPTAGTVTIDGVNMWEAGADLDALRRRIQMIFQDPYASLNPRWRVDNIIADPIRAFGLDVVTRLCEKLLAAGAPGLHFYSMNQAGPTLALCERLGLAG